MARSEHGERSLAAESDGLAAVTISEASSAPAAQSARSSRRLALFAGAGLIALGLVWNVMTRGARANGDSPTLPRASRVFLYLRLTLMAVILITWVVASHRHSAIEFLTDSSTLRGFERFGKPLLYSIIAATLALPATAALTGPATPLPTPRA